METRQGQELQRRGPTRPAGSSNSLELEKTAFRRLVASVNDPQDWLSFRQFVLDEMETQDSKKSKYELSPEPFRTSIWKTFFERALWLCGLMLFQSCSSFIMENYQDMLNRNLLVATFVTTLIGTGGNAGNQSTANTIRALSSGEVSRRTGSVFRLYRREGSLALMTAVVLAALVYGRVYLTTDDAAVSFALSLSMFLIVAISVVVGVTLTLLLSRLNLDPTSGAAPVMASGMDLFGVYVICAVCASYLT
eukprot:TRINITY_DN23661_c0_g1_i1.p1 TRINITY_DN23661_c0_g1~~TRINITY_DN23661_c0_g1_i1.p1  ORF type:complete len:250 (-),score=51.02 TRINITY_DN23661_c0_g1_i1:28-777(-)